ncbi:MULTISPECIES: TniQ family protein [Nocardia]|uniref:TniQ family protein n=1 Tax=Nocardia TaxID=1817 RepID=UPI001CC177BB|nr:MULTISPECIES: TniQ family protein [Nocardia]UAK31926.1 TniQ family protein [Nocardia asteroides]UAK33280.1 TniQ family protein [Nocardia asteroides]
MSAAMTLPLRVAIGEGEAVDSWIEALARRNGTSPLAVLQALGARPGLRNTRQLLGTTADEAILRRLEHAAGLPENRLDAAAARECDWATQLLVSGRSRFCPQCLAEGGGRWPLIWRWKWQLVCGEHNLLLHDSCPVCADTPRRLLLGGRDPIPPAACGYGPSRGNRCGNDLTAGSTRRAPREVLDTQQWIHDHNTENPATTASTGSPRESELTLVSDWLRGIDLDSVTAEAHAINPDREPTTYHPDGNPRYLDAALTAALLGRAKNILGTHDEPAIAFIGDIHAKNPAPNRFPPRRIELRRWQNASGRFPNRYVRAIDPDLGALTRLRLKSPTATAIHVGGQTTARQRALPQLLWPEWSARLLPASGFHAERFRATLATLLLVPGSAVGRAHRTTLNPRVNPGNCTALLQGMAKLPGGSAVTDVITVLCRIADYLDSATVPIDYQRRREVVPAEAITWQRWRDLACEIGAHPGEQGKGLGRIHVVQRHLHEILTGADLSDPNHPLVFRSPQDRGTYTTALGQFTPHLRRALRDYGQQLLAELGIEEPIIWSPPAELADGLTLPGIDPTDLDTDKIRRLVLDEKRAPSAVADLLGVHIEHVRLALEGLDRPVRQWSKHTAPVSWKLDRDAERTLTREFFEREYIQNKRTLADIGEATGFGKPRVSRIAKGLGVTLRKGADAHPIDQAWLRQQYCDKLRSTADIAAELDVDQMVVNNALHRFAIPTRPQGVFSRTEFLASLPDMVPTRVRTTVEGRLHGWLRLHRFRIAMQFPNLLTAQKYLGRSVALITQLQQLEKHIGGPLFDRSELGRHQHPTALGRALLEDLEDDNVAQLMIQALGAKALPMPDAETIAAAEAAVSKLARQTDPTSPQSRSAAELARQTAQQRKSDYQQIFADLQVEPVSIRAESSLIILQDLLGAASDESHGLAVLQRTGFTEGPVYQALNRFRKAGWLTVHLETHAARRARMGGSTQTSRRRTFFRLTRDGRKAAERVLANAQLRENVKPVRRKPRQTHETQQHSSRS